MSLPETTDSQFAALFVWTPPPPTLPTQKTCRSSRNRTTVKRGLWDFQLRSHFYISVQNPPTSPEPPYDRGIVRHEDSTGHRRPCPCTTAPVNPHPPHPFPSVPTEKITHRRSYTNILSFFIPSFFRRNPPRSRTPSDLLLPEPLS